MKKTIKGISVLLALTVAMQLLSFAGVYAAESVTEATLTKLVLADDFSGSVLDTSKWTNKSDTSSYVSVVQADGSAQAITGAGGSAAGGIYAARILTAHNTGSDFAAQFDMSIDKGTSATEYAGFYIRYQDESNFYALEWSRRIANANDRVALVKNGYEAANAVTPIQYPELYKTGWMMADGATNTYKVAVIGKNIKVYVDGTLIIDYTDDAMTLTDGKFGAFNRSRYGIYSTVKLDNVKLFNQEDPVDPESLLTHVNMTDSFSGSAFDTSKWTNKSDTSSYVSAVQADGSAQAITGVGGSAAGGTYAARILTTQNTGSDFAAQFDMSIDKGTSATEYAGFYIRYQDESNFYALEWSRRLANANDRVALVKNGYEAANAVTPIQYPGVYKTGWMMADGATNTYKVAVIGKNIKVYVDGTLIIDYTDDAMTLTDGKFGVFNRSMYGINSKVKLDNVTVYGYEPQQDLFETNEAVYTYYENYFENGSDISEVMYDFTTPNEASLGITDGKMDLLTGAAQSHPYAHLEKFIIGDGQWQNYVAKLDMKISESGKSGVTEFVNLSVRTDISANTGYTLSWNRRTNYLGFGKITGITTDTSALIQTVPVAQISNFDMYGWNTYKFVVNAGSVKIYVNDMNVPIIDYIDEAAITCGGLGLLNYTSYADQDHILIDNLSVKGIKLASPQNTSLTGKAELFEQGSGDAKYYKIYMSARVDVPESYSGEESGQLYVAFYNGAELAGMATGERTLTEGTRTDRVWTIFNVETLAENYSAKAFLWNGTDMLPLLVNVPLTIVE